MPAVIMPKMGDAMEEGTLLKWLKNEGDAVSEGDAIAEIETDKVTLELTAENAGTLARRIAQEGQSVPVGQPIAMIAGEGESADGGGEPQAAGTSGPPQREAPPDETGAQAPEALAGVGEGGESAHGAVLAVEQRPSGGAPGPSGQGDGRAAGAGAEAAGRVKASPLARRIAQEHELDLAQIQGSGPGGRIVREDVEAVLRQRREGGAAPAAPPAPTEAAPSRPSAPAAPTTPAAPGAGVESVPLTRMRATIARRMSESKATIPHIYVSAEVDMTEALQWRKRLNDTAAAEGYKVTVNDLVVRAAALALTKFPNLNASFAGDHVDQHRDINISIAVALKEGLIAPVVRNADQKAIGRISREAADLAGRAREGKLQPREFEGGTFTVSNLGPFGVDTFISIITLPQAAALAVGSSAQKAVVVDGQIVIRDRMNVTLSVDHRVSDGADAAQYLGELRRLLENPLALLM